MIEVIYTNLDTNEKICRKMPIPTAEQIDLMLNGFVAEEYVCEITGIRASMKANKMDTFEEDLIAMGMDNQKMKLLNTLGALEPDYMKFLNAVNAIKDNRFRVFEKCNDMVDVAKVLVSEGYTGREICNIEEERPNY